MTEKDESGDSYVTQRSEEGGRVVTLGDRTVCFIYHRHSPG